jgi:hypothetical protein
MRASDPLRGQGRSTPVLALELCGGESADAAGVWRTSSTTSKRAKS